MHEDIKTIRREMMRLASLIVGYGKRVLEMEGIEPSTYEEKPYTAKELGKDGFPLEGAIQERIRIALGNDPLVYLPRNNVGLFQSLDGRMVRSGLGKGTSDLIGLLGPHGRFIALEVKRHNGRATKEQETFAKAVRLKGGFCAFVRSPQEALEAIARAKKGGFE